MTRTISLLEALEAAPDDQVFSLLDKHVKFRAAARSETDVAFAKAGLDHLFLLVYKREPRYRRMLLSWCERRIAHEADQDDLMREAEALAHELNLAWANVILKFAQDTIATLETSRRGLPPYRPELNDALIVGARDDFPKGRRRTVPGRRADAPDETHTPPEEAAAWLYRERVAGESIYSIARSVRDTDPSRFVDQDSAEAAVRKRISRLTSLLGTER